VKGSSQESFNFDTKFQAEMNTATQLYWHYEILTLKNTLKSQSNAENRENNRNSNAEIVSAAFQYNFRVS
jgi:hypothetical protein